MDARENYPASGTAGRCFQSSLLCLGCSVLVVLFAIAHYRHQLQQAAFVMSLQFSDVCFDIFLVAVISAEQIQTDNDGIGSSAINHRQNNEPALAIRDNDLATPTIIVVIL